MPLPVVLAATERVTFTAQIGQGEIVELAAQLADVGRTSIKVGVELWAENLHSGDRRHCGTGTFVMVAIGDDHRPVAFPADQ